MSQEPFSNDYAGKYKLHPIFEGKFMNRRKSYKMGIKRGINGIKGLQVFPKGERFC